MRFAHGALVATIPTILIGGCQSSPNAVHWTHLERRADPLGEERYVLLDSIGGARTDGQAVVITGMVGRDVHVDVWNVYRCTEDWNFGQKRRLVADPIGKPLPGADPTLTPASIKGIDRAPVGPQWERADYGVGASCQVQWIIAPLKQNNATISSGVVAPDRSGQFVVRLEGQPLKDAAYLPMAHVEVVLLVTGPTTPDGRRSFGNLTVVVPRNLFVDALGNGR